MLSKKLIFFQLLIMLCLASLSFAQSVSYTYDDLNRLKTMTVNGSTSTYTYDEVGNILSVVSTNPIVSIAISPVNPQVRVNQTQQFTATATYADNTTGVITPLWNSTNQSAATINASGLLTGVNPGTTNITATKDSVTSPVSVVTVTTNNTQPVLNPIGNKAASSFTQISFNVSATDSDGDPLTLSAKLSNNDPLINIGASFVNNGNGTGTFTWTPLETQIGLNPSIIFRVDDTDGFNATETITITVTDSGNRKAQLLTPTPSVKIVKTTETFTWGNASGATAYELDVGTTQGGANVFNGSTTTNTSQVVSGITLNGSTLYARLKSTINGTVFFNDYTYPTGPDDIAPSKPANLTTPVITYHQVDLAWNASTDNVGVTGYKVYRNGNEIGQTNAATLMYSDTTAQPNSNYSYTVKAFDALNNLSIASDPAPATTGPDNEAPTKPSNLQLITRTETSINFQWNASTDLMGVAGYKVLRNGVQIFQTGVGVTSYNNTNLIPNTPYTYTLIAFDAAGNNSIVSDPLNVSTLNDTTSPTKPGNLQTTLVEDNRVDFQWPASTDNIGVTGYKVFRDNTQIGQTVAGVTSFSDTNVIPSTAYAYKVQAFDAAGNNSVFSNVLNVTTAVDTEAPSVPQNVRTTAITTSRVDLAWNASTDNAAVTGYKILRGGSLLNTVNGSTLTFSDTTVAPNTNYSYTVIAVDARSNESAPSSPPLSVMTNSDTTAPSKPLNLTQTQLTFNRVDFQWTASTDNIAVTGYKILRNGSPLIQIGATTSYSDTTVLPNTSYSYTVIAIDGAGNNSLASDPLNVTTPSDSQAPTKPLNLISTLVTYNRIDLQWTASTDNIAVTGYKVLRGGSLIFTTAGNVTTYMDTTVVPGTTYSYTIIAIDAQNNNSPASDALVVTSAPDLEPPTKPLNLRKTFVTFNQIDLAWDASSDNAGIDHYLIKRDGVDIGQTNGATTTFTDNTVQANTSYNYTVTAFDARNNASPVSNGLNVTTPSVTEFEYHWLEAEYANTLISPLRILNDSLASNTKYLGTTSNGTGDNQGYATINFTINKDGNYIVLARGFANNGFDNSFWVSVDGGPEYQWDLDDYANFWHWDPVNGYLVADPILFSLNAGPHTIKFRVREDGTKLDKIVITNDLVFEPENMGSTAENMPPNDTTPPSKVQGLQSTLINSTSVDLQWNASTDNVGVSGYRIFENGSQIDDILGSELTYTASSLQPNKNYTYTIVAYDSSGNVSQPSNPLTVKTLAASLFELHWLEAENGQITAPMQISQDTNASFGKYVETPNNTGGGGFVQMRFRVTQPGNYKIIGRGYTTDGFSNSFFVSMDGSAELEWHLADESPMWTWDIVDNGSAPDPIPPAYIYNLTAGEHVIKFRTREDGTKLDKILITNDVNYHPTSDEQLAENLQLIGYAREYGTNTPIIGAEIALKGKPLGKKTSIVMETLTDATGKFIFNGVLPPAKDYTVQGKSQKNSKTFKFAVDLNYGVGTPRLGRKITDIKPSMVMFGIPSGNIQTPGVPGTRSITGYVLSNAGSAGVSGVKLKLTQKNGVSIKLDSVSESDGYFRFENLPNGEYQLKALPAAKYNNPIANIIINNGNVSVNISQK